MAFYLDTSALVKLVIEEVESAALQAWRSPDVELVSCDLARAELMRAVRRAAPDSVQAARAVLDGLILLSVGTATFEDAGRLSPDALRTLDAVHLAAALGLGDDLEGVVTYDDRLAEAAHHHGIPVIAPGR